jgi:uncharacterized metal-binding protein
MEGSKGKMVVAIETMDRSCSLCENYARSQQGKPIAVLSCEGACLRGEVARRAANLISFELAPERTARICLGSAFTKDAGQRGLVENAETALVLEGCFLRCASRMMAGAARDPRLEVVIVDSLYHFDHDVFGVDLVADSQISLFAREAAENIFNSAAAFKETIRPDGAV